MSFRTLRTAFLLGLGAALLMVSVAYAAKADTKVKIKEQTSGFYGSVKSDDVNCAAERKVILYKMKGDEPKPKSDKNVGTDKAQANGNKYTWAINTAKNGDFYAFAKEKDGCKEGTSKVLSRN